VLASLLWGTLLAAAFPARIAWAGEAVTVISVTGAVSRGTGDGKWIAVAAGERLDTDTVVRTAPQAALRYVDAKGALGHVAGGVEAPLGRAAAAQKTGAAERFLSVLHELFADARPTDTAAIRGEKPSSRPPSSAPPGGPAAEWERLIGKPKLVPEDLAPLFETASHYAESEYRNRSVALLALLPRDFPREAGFAELARQALEVFGTPANLEVLVNRDGALNPVSPGAVWLSGDQMQVRYASPVESHAYLFLTTLPNRGQPSTVRFYPEPGATETPVAPGSALQLPKPDQFYTVDETAGREVIWGWACVAATSEVGSAQAKVAGRLKSGGTAALQPALVRDAAPSGCPQAFVLAFEHR
jgi:hypothetical protein